MKTEQERLDFISGQIVVLRSVCAMLLGTRTDRNDLIKVIKGMQHYPIEKVSSDQYRAGIKDIVEELDALSDLATLAALFRAQGVGSKPD